MKKRNFANIVTTYNDRNKELNLENLSHLYDDECYLRNMIHRVMIEDFDEDEIKGKSVLLKPNWVLHEEKPTDKVCLCTHENFIIATLIEILSLQPKKVLIADAPVNICKWDCLLSKEFQNRIKELEKEYGISIALKDFRRTISDLKNNKIQNDRVSMDEYIIFDVGSESYLEEITTDENRFRITNYNPDRMKEVHHKGTHKYCITRDFFDYDVVITLPKIKTHKKAGFTNALKILIGINGDKEYLPHHRLGALNNGGDCYKERNFFSSMSEWFSDQANKHLGGWLYKPLVYAKIFFWKMSRAERGMDLSASWYGNDTIWRTVLDIQKIAQYGRITPSGEGVIEKKKQRNVYSLCDGIIAGQGNGPLTPDPLALGVVAFSDNPYLMDTVGGMLLGLNVDKVPLLHFAKEHSKEHFNNVFVNGEITSVQNIKQYSVVAQMPTGWVHYND